MKIHGDIIQGSDKWDAIRLGKVTGSNASKVLAKGEYKTRWTYMKQLANERLYGKRQDHFCSADMERGTELEPLARNHYEDITGVKVQQGGFIEHSEDVGFSPDGLIDEDGGMEIKVLKPENHFDIIAADLCPKQFKGQPSPHPWDSAAYNGQMQFSMWVTKREWWDWCSFDPNLIGHKMFKIRVYRNDSYIETLEKEVAKFVTELKALVNTIDQSPF